MYLYSNLNSKTNKHPISFFEMKIQGINQEVIEIINDKAVLQTTLQYISKENVVGFDLQCIQRNSQKVPCWIQIASNKIILIIRTLGVFPERKRDDTQVSMFILIREFLEDTNTVKVGVGISGDASTLSQYGIELARYLDIQWLAHKSPNFINQDSLQSNLANNPKYHPKIGLKYLSRIILGVDSHPQHNGRWEVIIIICIVCTFCSVK